MNFIPTKYAELAEQIATNLEHWAEPKDKTGLRYQYVGYLKPINIALEGFEEILAWLYSNRPENCEYVQRAYDKLISQAKLDDHLLETMYESDETLSEECAIDFAHTLRVVVKMAEGVAVEEPTVISPEAEQEIAIGFMSVVDLAKKHGVNAENLRKRLDRYRAKHPLDVDFFVESQNRGRNKPKYLYNVKLVSHIIEELKDK
ncbi:hypothetical protein ACFL1G_11805 [Planctomycetota bacterium]